MSHLQTFIPTTTTKATATTVNVASQPSHQHQHQHQHQESHLNEQFQHHQHHYHHRHQQQQNQQDQNSAVIMKSPIITKSSPPSCPCSSNSPSSSSHDFQGIMECCASSSPDMQITSRRSKDGNYYGGIKEINRCDGEGRIKRPMNAFMVWSQMRRAQIASTDVKMHNSEISKELGAEWRKMSAEDKAPYVERAKELREDLMRRHPNYVYRPRRRSNGKSMRITSCTVIPSSCPQPPSSALEQRGRSGAKIPTTQDVSAQLLMAKVAQEQRNNMLFAAYPNPFLAASTVIKDAAVAAATTTIAGSWDPAVDHEKLRSTMESILTGNSSFISNATSEPFNFLPAVSLLQQQYLNPLLGNPSFNPFLLGQYPQQTSFPAAAPVVVQK